jgi:hypothetical protein
MASCAVAVPTNVYFIEHNFHARFVTPLDVSQTAVCYCSCIQLIGPQVSSALAPPAHLRQIHTEVFMRAPVQSSIPIGRDNQRHVPLALIDAAENGVNVAGSAEAAR